MTEIEKKLVELSFKKDELKKQYEELDADLEQVCTELGVGHMFEDEQGTVYKVEVPKGHFVAFKHIGFARTRRGDEKAGTLTLKEAKEWKDSCLLKKGV